MDLFFVCSFRTTKEQNIRKRNLDKIFHVEKFTTIYISVSKQSSTGKERYLNVKSGEYFFNKLFSNDKESKALSTNGAGVAGYLHARINLDSAEILLQKLTQNEL